jgi:hypothetical protein
VKEVFVENRRSIVCLNVEQARKDKADRDAKDSPANGTSATMSIGIFEPMGGW